MPKLFTPEEIKRQLAGKFSKECAIELLKQGKYGERMTRASFKAHKECIKKKFEEEVKKRIERL